MSAGPRRFALGPAAERPPAPAPAAEAAAALLSRRADPDPTWAGPCVEVDIGAHGMAGKLAQVPDARGLVVFAQGRCRQGVCQRRVAEVLHGYRLDTLLLDLLTPAEVSEGARAVDLELLGRRLDAALQWSRSHVQSGRLCAGLFGACSAAAAALRTAASHPGWVAAVVSGGGRTDLMTADGLARVQAPTLLIVGGHDSGLLKFNRNALRALRCESRLEVVAGATHRFDEPGATETVAHLAASWFANHLPLRAHG